MWLVFSFGALLVGEDINIFLTLNPHQKIKEGKIFKKVKFTHPYYDQNTLSNQKNLQKLQNRDNILFCGSYFVMVSMKMGLNQL